uniref:Pre-mRNA-splicing factor 18 n=1 Tax=Glossina austeni TaxID=7395 RepID=A0A1A9VE81_GLOAU
MKQFKYGLGDLLELQQDLGSKMLICGNSIAASDAYLEIAIGNAPWSVGVTIVGYLANDCDIKFGLLEKVAKLLKFMEKSQPAQSAATSLYKQITKCGAQQNKILLNVSVLSYIKTFKEAEERQYRIEFIDQREVLKSGIQGKRKRLQQERQALSGHIGVQIERIENERQHREELWLSLLIEERKAKEDAR